MYSEARKLHLIEDVLKIKSETVLTELENIVKKAMRSKQSEKASAKDFLGLISKKDVELMENAIEEGCEQINPDDWKS
jgi:hypothetical protein